MLPKEIRSAMTIYNQIKIGEPEVAPPAAVENVYFQASYGARIRDKGVHTENRAKAIIMLSSITGYLPAHEYGKLDSRTGFWTLQKGDKFVNFKTSEVFEKLTDIEKSSVSTACILLLN